MTDGGEDRVDRAPRYRDLFGTDHDHGAECAYCPICTAIALARRSRPEVVEHLAGAAREILLALGIILEEAEARMRAAEQAHAGQPRPARPAGADPATTGSKLRRIDIG